MNTLLLSAISSRLQSSALVIGIVGIVIGLLLMKGHQAVFEQSLSKEATEGTRRYEARKLRRRTIVAGLVTSVGCMLSAIYWVREIKVLAILTLLIVCQLVMILGFVIVDSLFIGLRTFGKPDERRQREVLEEFLRMREQSTEKEPTKDNNE